jgi:glutathione S-transferase
MSSPPCLVSFKLCPFVQRSVITLEHKQVPYDVRYIELAEPPEWFLRLSPLHKVPMLMVGEDVLFESAVINEYLDETNPPQMLADDPLLRAHQRAWIAYGSELIGNQYLMLTAADRETYRKHYQRACARLQRLEQAMGEGPYFSAAELSLVDTAFAPLFMRFSMLFSQLEEAGCLSDTPRVRAWSAALLALPAVQRSVVADFKVLFAAWIVEQNGYLAAHFRAGVDA